MEAVFAPEELIDLTRVVCELGRSLRAQAKIRNRQPLSLIRVGTTSHHEAEWLQEYRWWSLRDLAAAAPGLNVEPANLAGGIRRYLRDGLPDVPYDIDQLA